MLTIKYTIFMPVLHSMKLKRSELSKLPKIKELTNSSADLNPGFWLWGERS